MNILWALFNLVVAYVLLVSRLVRSGVLARRVQASQHMTSPATAKDIQDVLGDVDGFLVERILETQATVDDVVEALAAVEDERRVGQRREPTSARVTEVRAILEELLEEPDDEDRAS